MAAPLEVIGLPDDVPELAFHAGPRFGCYAAAASAFRFSTRLPALGNSTIMRVARCRKSSSASFKTSAPAKRAIGREPAHKAPRPESHTTTKGRTFQIIHFVKPLPQQESNHNTLEMNTTIFS